MPRRAQTCKKTSVPGGDVKRTKAHNNDRDSWRGAKRCELRSKHHNGGYTAAFKSWLRKLKIKTELCPK